MNIIFKYRKITCILILTLLLVPALASTIKATSNDSTISTEEMPSVDINVIRPVSVENVLKITIVRAMLEDPNLSNYLLHNTNRLMNDLNEAVEQKQQEELIQQEKALAEERWNKKVAEYPEAAYVWKYLKSCGYNDYVCAGILGNIMAEVGGYTLNIKPCIYGIYNRNYYGMCMWSLYYCPEVRGMTLEQQCQYLTNTIEYQFNMFSWVYYRGFSYAAFKEMNSAEQAALAFAKIYERCGSASYGHRQRCAVTAYNYFTS